MHKSKHVQLFISTPCHEDWEKMTPQQQGRFCDSCQKCVTDFTRFTDRELYEFFQQHKGEKVCGRFYDTQFNRRIALPPQPHSQLYKWIIAAGLTLLFTAGPDTKIFAQTPYAQEQVHKSVNGSISGTVVGPDADNNMAPLIGVKVVAYEGGLPAQETVTDVDGAFLLKPLSPGRYDVRVSAPGYNESTATGIIVSPDKEIIISFEINNEKSEIRIKEPQNNSLNKISHHPERIYITGEVSSLTPEDYAEYTRHYSEDSSSFWLEKKPINNK